MNNIAYDHEITWDQGYKDIQIIENTSAYSTNVVHIRKRVTEKNTSVELPPPKREKEIDSLSKKIELIRVSYSLNSMEQIEDLLTKFFNENQAPELYEFVSKVQQAIIQDTLSALTSSETKPMQLTAEIDLQVTTRKIIEVTLQQIIFVIQSMTDDDESLPKPGDNYSRYPGRQKDLLAWIRDFSPWAEHLTYFGASRNTLFQDQLAERDYKLLMAIKNWISEQRKSGSDIKVRDIIPPKSERGQQQIDFFRALGISEKTIYTLSNNLARKSKA